MPWTTLDASSESSSVWWRRRQGRSFSGVSPSHELPRRLSCRLSRPGSRDAASPPLLEWVSDAYTSTPARFSSVASSGAGWCGSPSVPAACGKPASGHGCTGIFTVHARGWLSQPQELSAARIRGRCGLTRCSHRMGAVDPPWHRVGRRMRGASPWLSQRGCTWLQPCRRASRPVTLRSPIGTVPISPKVGPLETVQVTRLGDPSCAPSVPRRVTFPVTLRKAPSDLRRHGAAFGIRTRDLRITSALLWPTELRRRDAADRAAAEPGRVYRRAFTRPDGYRASSVDVCLPSIRAIQTSSPSGQSVTCAP